MKNLIIINGVMGVGKTTVCKKLYRKLDKAIWLDGDWCWMMDPFVVTEETKSMVQDNIVHMLNNYLKCSEYKNIVFNWVIDEEYIYDLILDNLYEPYNLYKITLTCSKETLVKRIQKDVDNHLRDYENIQRSLSKYDKYQLLDTIKVNTDHKDINAIINEIKDIIVE